MTSHRQIVSVCMGSLLVGFLAFAPAHAASPPWSFNPQKTGRALYEGGWMAEYSLGRIDASPEFSFPLQLIYLSGREQKGIFGSQFFCPQLETTILPRGTDILVWSMPSGGLMGFKADGRRTSEYVSMDGNWRAEVSTTKQTVFNEDGWKFAYARGRLEGITSPTGRVLEYLWTGNNLTTVQIRDPLTKTGRVLVQLAYRGKQVSDMIVDGRPIRFAYRKDGADDRLSALAPPIGREIRFFYDSKSGVLAGTQTGKGQDDLTEFATVFVTPFEGEKPSKEPTPERNPKNYWLTADRDFQYSYGVDPKKKERWLPDQVSLEGNTGIKRQVNVSSARGIITSTQGKMERMTYYYRAPGQKFDGKLRRIEENGQMKVEYRYDRRTGLLTEMIDATGITTFFDYPSNWKPQRRASWEPKPVRIRRGDRNKNEVVAEYAYNDDGRLTAVKDAAGNLTRYAYTPRGDLASVLDPAGGRTDFTYDSFGRRIAVAKNGLKESVEYDSFGRITAKIAPDGTRTEFSFDKTGLLSKVSSGDKAIVEYARDENGFVTAEKDAIGRIKRVQRDTRGNLLAEIAANGAVTRYEYDAQSRRIAQIDGNGNKITFAYDPAGRLIKQSNPLGGGLTWAYDDLGRLRERTNGEQSISHTYDPTTQKLTQVDYGKGQTITYGHDREGRIVSATTPTTRFEYEHDKHHHVESLRVVQGNDDHLLRYQHNTLGQRTGLILARLIPAVAPSGGRTGKEARYEALQQVEYAYESGRLASISSSGAPVITYKYDSEGRPIKKTYGNGITASIAYDAMGRLTQVAFSGGGLSEPQTLTYEWDAANQVTRRAWAGQVQRYHYDPSGQLLRAVDEGTGEPMEAYAYDKAGNMLEKVIDGTKTVMTYNAANQLTTVASASLPMSAAPQDATADLLAKMPRIPYFYDKAGRMLGAAGGARSDYGWLDKVITLTTKDGAQIAYDYWPDGQLASKRSISPPQRSANLQDATADGIRRVANLAGDSAQVVSETYLWDGLALLRRGDTIYINEPHPSGGSVIASHPVGKPKELTYYLNDLLGTTLATVEAGFTTFASLTAFGQPLKLASNIPQPTDLATANNPPIPLPATPNLH